MSWFYFSWRSLTPFSDNLRLWGGSGRVCVIIGLEEITRCLKFDRYVIVFYLEMDVFSIIMPKLTGAALVQGFHVVSFLQLGNDGVRNVSPDLSDMKGKWDPPLCCINSKRLCLCSGDHAGLTMSEPGRVELAVISSTEINRSRCHSSFLCCASVLAPTLCDVGLFFGGFLCSVLQSEPRPSPNLLSQVHQSDQCLWATRSVCGSLVQPFPMTGN